MRLKSLATSVAIIATSLCTPAMANTNSENNYFVGVNTGFFQSTKPKGNFTPGKMGNGHILGIEAGYKINDNFRTSFGIDFIQDFKHKGIDNETANYENLGMVTTNIKHSIKVKSIPFMINGYYDIAKINNFTPYLMGGLGFSKNRTSHSTDLSYISEDISQQPVLSNANHTTSYKSGKRTSFAYKLGAGIQYSFSDRMSLDLRYQYVDLGKFKTGNSNTTSKGETANSTPLSGKIKYNQLLLGLVFKF